MAPPVGASTTQAAPVTQAQAQGAGAGTGNGAVRLEDRAVGRFLRKDFQGVSFLGRVCEYDAEMGWYKVSVYPYA